MALLAENHFLALPRPDVLLGPPAGVVDTTTLAAHDFDVDTRTGFMPPDPPLARLPAQWEIWEQLLDDAQAHRLQLGNKHDITDVEIDQSESWRIHVRHVGLVCCFRCSLASKSTDTFLPSLSLPFSRPSICARRSFFCAAPTTS